MLQYKLNEEFGTPLFYKKQELKDLYNKIIKILNKKIINTPYKYPSQEIILDINKLNFNLVNTNNLYIKFIINNIKKQNNEKLYLYKGFTNSELILNNTIYDNIIISSESKQIVITLIFNSSLGYIDENTFYSGFIHEYTHFYEFCKRKINNKSIGIINKINYDIIDNFIDKDDNLNKNEKNAIKNVFYYILTPTERNAYISGMYAELLTFNKSKKYKSINELLNDTYAKSFILSLYDNIQILENINDKKLKNLRINLVKNYLSENNFDLLHTKDIVNNENFKKWLIKISKTLLSHYKRKIYKMTYNFSDIYNLIEKPNNFLSRPFFNKKELKESKKDEYVIWH